ncbi:unnamed protein product [Nippostrongylus brasiliensis]|uniref:Retrotrans_gag domain-containing protein n=1 Tax=Nippostrongylus brasiliensis TaxID=27835 RepID=A0A0N4Y443_NIPBR|nr:unnamed protein product [Nippostrongylus brasiliensis]
MDDNKAGAAITGTTAAPGRRRPRDPRRVTDEGDKRLIFLQEVGAANYELLESLLQGKQPETATMAQMEEVMEQHFQPKKLLIAKRFGLMSKTQKHGQILQEYYVDLQKAANTYGFERMKDHRDMVVAMVFIGGYNRLKLGSGCSKGRNCRPKKF